MTHEGHRQLSPLEVSSGLVIPARRRAPRLPSVAAGTTPRLALERAILPALRRAPCVVSFSGGRDSSAVLALAADLARREGLPPPIPVTHRFPSASATQETEWQEQVIAFLGLEEWVRIEATGDLDCVGPIATETLRRHGVLWPCNAYFHVPIVEAAAGGALLTGVGGDEAFSASSWARALAVLGRRARPVPRDVLRVGFALSPQLVKRAAIRRSLPEFGAWLRPAARRAIHASIASEAATEPLRWASRFRELAGSGYMEVSLGSLGVLAADAGVEIGHPFHDPHFLAALAALEPACRFRSRTEAMQMLVGDLLPPALIGRATKARFSEVFWAEHSRALVARWQGEGVDPEIVDVERLREEWHSPAPAPHTFTLLQHVWLALEAARSAVGEIAQPVGGLGHRPPAQRAA
jgi:asparagine synthetase B (glutamine-hydrolysing)